jgi:hypothetical protein
MIFGMIYLRIIQLASHGIPIAASTITYVLAGTVEQGDSMGNSGSIGVGDVQWMTAGS